MEYFDYLPTLNDEEKEELFKKDAEDCCTYHKLEKLSKYRLFLMENMKFGKQIEKLSSYIIDNPKYIKVNLGVVGNYTMDHLNYHMIAAAFRRGIVLEIEFSLYNSIYPIALGEIQPFKNKLDYMLIHSSQEKYYESKTSICDMEKELNYIIDSIQTRYQTKVILTNCTQGFYDDTSSINPVNNRNFNAFKEEYNALCRTIVQNNSSTLLLDLDKLSGYVGSKKWNNPMDYYRSKIPFAYEYADIFSDYLARLIASYMGLRKKVVALDLDGVLWGGILGDDKIGNIAIGNGSAEGEAFFDFQKYLYAQLYETGIVLTIVSKNNMDNVKEVFQSCSSMILKEEHFAMLQVNWNDKASNLEVIAKTLNVGLDSIVFIDDNKYERDLVRQQLSAVTTLELGNNPAEYASHLANSGYFDCYALSKEDLGRTKSYKNRVRSIEFKRNFADYNEYLKSLNMKLDFCPFEPINMVRIIQLINKTNQFNLMCNRVTHQDIAGLMDNKQVFTVQVALEDKLENYGIISVLICEISNDILYINTWVMSCRVFNRSIEEAVINYSYHYAKQEKLTHIIGMCKNEKEGSYVEGLYPKRGFRYFNTDEGVTYYALDLNHFQECDCVHSMIRGQYGKGNI